MSVNSVTVGTHVNGTKSIATLYAECAIARSDLMLEQLGFYVNEVAAQNDRLGEIGEAQKKIRTLLDQFTTQDSNATGTSGQVKNANTYASDLAKLKTWLGDHGITYELTTKGSLESALAGLKADAENMSSKVGSNMALAGDFRGKADLAMQELVSLLKSQRELLERILQGFS